MDKLADKNFVRLPLQGVQNCRDLGGYYSKKGSVTAWKKFLRSSRLDKVTGADQQFLKDYGVTTIIDLRKEDEIKTNESHPDLVNDFDMNVVDLIGESIRASKLAKTKEYMDDALVLGKMYVSILETGKDIRKVFDLILEKQDNGAVLFHCTAGKDRTGVISLLLLGLAGVSKKDIITNYEVSGTNISVIVQQEMSDFAPNVLGSHPTNIEMAYNHIMDNYGTFEDYFKWLGYTEQDIRKLANHILEN